MSRIPLDILIGLSPENETRSDFSPVSRRDQGNETYDERGMLGGYATNDGRPWKPPADVRYFTGFGGDMSDLKRGYCEPEITDNPAYDLSNYKDRSSQPREGDVGPGNVDAVPDDWEFRNRNRRSEGFLTRPRIPTERG